MQNSFILTNNSVLKYMSIKLPHGMYGFNVGGLFNDGFKSGKIAYLMLRKLP